MRRRDFLRLSATGVLATVSPALPASGKPAAGQKIVMAGKRVIEVKGRAANVLGLTQPDGSNGLVMDAGENFRVRLENRIGEPTVIHWHGLTPPWRQDGVAGLSQDPIADGGRREYDFPVAQPGTFWMHSHFGLQGQSLLAAPLIVRDPAEAGMDVQDIVVLFQDFSFRDPAEILAELRSAAQGRADVQAPPSDSLHDALLANDRTLDDPEIISVEPGGRIRLRLINGAASTNMWIDLGTLTGRLIAVDGMPVAPVDRRYFELAVAQRLDIMLELPRDRAAWPVLAVQERGRMRTGVMLAARGAPVEKLANLADETFPTVGLGLEQALRAASPLADRKVTRRHTMMLREGSNYMWDLVRATHGEDSPFVVRRGDRVELTFLNYSGTSHPLHLHGHRFQVTAVNRQRFSGAVRDTVLVSARMGEVTVALDADNAGEWALGCHHLYHMAGGMMTSMAYEA